MGPCGKRGRIDGIIGPLSTKGIWPAWKPGVKEHPEDRRLSAPLYGPHPSFAIVNEAVKIAKISHQASSGLVNAILRNIIRRKSTSPIRISRKTPPLTSHRFISHPLWLVERWLKHSVPKRPWRSAGRTMTFRL